MKKDIPVNTTTDKGAAVQSAPSDGEAIFELKKLNVVQNLIRGMSPNTTSTRYNLNEAIADTIQVRTSRLEDLEGQAIPRDPKLMAKLGNIIIVVGEGLSVIKKPQADQMKLLGEVLLDYGEHIVTVARECLPEQDKKELAG